MGVAAMHPALSQAADSSALGSPEAVVARSWEVATALRPAVDAVIATHLDHGPPVIIEGDYLLPTDLRAFATPGRRVRAVFLFEQEEQLKANFIRREPDVPGHDLRAKVSFLYGEQLRALALRHGNAAVAARPWSTLLARVTAALL